MRDRTQLLRLALFVAVAPAAVAPAAAHAQSQQTLSVNAATDSLLATGIPGGSTTAQVRRPDALTGAPVVIGQYTDLASILPFTINTTTPTAFDPDGDCWQRGALPLPAGTGLTPDIRSGDTVALSSGLSLVVQPGSDTAAGGPAIGCGDITSYAFNGVTAVSGGNGADLAVSGVAQALATGVAVTATDGVRTTAPVDAALAADGTWTATVPADQLAPLADGPLTIAGVYAVPDVATAAPAHIPGAPGSFTKRTPPPDPPAVGPPPPPPAAPVTGPAPAGPSVAPSTPKPAPPAVGRLDGIRAPSRITLARARRGGLQVSFVVPAGVKAARVALARGTRTAFTKLLTTGAPGSRQTLKLTGPALKRALRRGRYTLSVATGASRASLGTPVRRTVRVR